VRPPWLRVASRWPIIVGPLAGALLWPAVTWLPLMPQRRAEREQAI
jgi:hypothetical protein